MENLTLGGLDLQQYLTCLKCKMIIENPFEIECCGTLFCYVCIQNYLTFKEKENCTKCLKTAYYRQNSFVKRIVNGMQLTCNYGCGKKFSSNEIKIHMISCEYREYFCNMCVNNTKIKNNNEIKFCGRKKEFMMHLLEEHENELINYNDNFINIKINNIELENKRKLLNYSILEEAKENSNGYRPNRYYGVNDDNDDNENEDDDNDDNEARIMRRRSVLVLSHLSGSYEENYSNHTRVAALSDEYTEND